MKLFKFEVVTPESIFYNDEVESITFKTLDGEIGIMANHAPMLIANVMCALKIKKNNNNLYAFISEGIVEITDKKVVAIVDFAEWIDKIDIDSAIKNKENLEKRLIDEKEDNEIRAELVASIERAKVRIKTAKGIRD